MSEPHSRSSPLYIPNRSETPDFVPWYAFWRPQYTRHRIECHYTAGTAYGLVTFTLLAKKFPGILVTVLSCESVQQIAIKLADMLSPIIQAITIKAEVHIRKN